MQEKFEKMKELCRVKEEGQYLYSNKLGNTGENFNLYYSSTVSSQNVDLFNEIIKYTINDDNFEWFISELKRDANALYELNERAGKEHKDKSDASYKSWERRQGCNKYCGTDNRKKIDVMSNTSMERICESKLYENYFENEHPVIGYSRKVQVPIMREANGKRAIDIIFQKDNIIYICELKKNSESGGEGILRCICEILTYYFTIQKHVQADGKNKFFYKECTKSNYNDNIDYQVQPAIICPASFVAGININSFIEKLSSECGINLKIVILKNDEGILE